MGDGGPQNLCLKFVDRTLVAGLPWLFAELGTECHYLQRLELFAKLLAACATIWRAWHCLSFVEFGFICRARHCRERLALLVSMSERTCHCLCWWPGVDRAHSSWFLFAEPH